jgi:integrase
MHSPRFHLSTKGISADWPAPQSAASAATIGVSPEVIARIYQLKALTVNVKAGNAIRNYKLVKSSNPDDLVFQSVKEGKPMRDNNILKRFIKPAANKVALSFVNWQCLRTSHATWLVQAGADPKSVQGQMRHFRISTTMDIYAQIVPAQRQAIVKPSEFVNESVPKPVPTLVQ